MKNLKTIISVIMAVGLVVGYALLENYLYNNGECRKCGGELVFINAIQDKESSIVEHIYECADCHNTIRVNEGVSW